MKADYLFSSKSSCKLVYDLGVPYNQMKPKYVKMMEKKLSDELEKRASESISVMQGANCDLLKIGE